MKRIEVIEKILAYFEENNDIFNCCIEELDGWNGYLGDDRWNDMDEIDDIFSSETPSYILARAYYGSDVCDGEFRPCANYFRTDGYGNLVSSDYCDYSNYNTAQTVEDMAANRDNIDTIADKEELEQLFDELENAEDEEEV